MRPSISGSAESNAPSHRRNNAFYDSPLADIVAGLRPRRLVIAGDAKRLAATTGGACAVLDAVGFATVMKLLGHASPQMTMRYLDVALSDLRREFDLARSKPRHLAPQPKSPIASLRAGLGGVIDALLSAQHVLEMFRRTLPKAASRSCLARLSNRLTKIVAVARKLNTP